jgi:hypothetical protein
MATANISKENPAIYILIINKPPPRRNETSSLVSSSSRLVSSSALRSQEPEPAWQESRGGKPQTADLPSAVNAASANFLSTRP